MERKKQKKKQLFATLLLVICTLFCYSCSMLGIIDYDQKAIGIAQQLIRSDLKNPSSAIWNDVHVELNDDYYRYVVYVDVSAQNGFGGYTRDQYYVGFRIDKNGETFYYSPYLYCVNATSFFTAETAKNMFSRTGVNLLLKNRLELI